MESSSGQKTSSHSTKPHKVLDDKRGHNQVELGVELFEDFVAMFFVMYAMFATVDHFYFNIGNVYMALMMVATMELLMLIFMRDMYRSKRWNVVVLALAVLFFATGWYGMRAQLGVGD